MITKVVVSVLGHEVRTNFAAASLLQQVKTSPVDRRSPHVLSLMMLWAALDCGLPVYLDDPRDPNRARGKEEHDRAVLMGEALAIATPRTFKGMHAAALLVYNAEVHAAREAVAA